MDIGNTARSGLDVRDLEVDAASPREVFAKVASLFGDDPERVVEALTAREDLGSTETGGEVAMPHATLEGLDHGVLVDVRLPRAVAWGDTTVRRCLCVVTPPDSKTEHTTLLAEAARRALDR